MSEPLTNEDAPVENISLGDVLDGLKWLANKTRLPGQPEIKYTDDGAPVGGAAPSEHWDQLDNALRVVNTHAQALIDDWDNQQGHVENALFAGDNPGRGIFAGDNAGRGNGLPAAEATIGLLIQRLRRDRGTDGQVRH